MRFSREERVRLREAVERDVPTVLGLINGYARENLVLARTEESLRECLSDFAVAEVEGVVAGCGALSELGPGLGEIRSLAVRGQMSGRGIGRAIIEHHMARAFGRGFVEVLALTRRVSLFEKLGFHVTRRERFLDKLAADCQACPLSLCCDEIAVHWIPPEALAAARDLAGATGGGAHPESGADHGDVGGESPSRAAAQRAPLFARLLPV